MFEGFRKFILRGNVIDLAVGVVIGAAFNIVVQSLVKDVITPLIGIIGGLPDFSSFTFNVRNSKFLVGDLINSIISFLLIATVIYFAVVKPINKLMSFRQKEKPADKKICPYCLSEIPINATKCAFCTADLKVKA